MRLAYINPILIDYKVQPDKMIEELHRELTEINQLMNKVLSDNDSNISEESRNIEKDSFHLNF
jgi:hypothetical protein